MSKKHPYVGLPDHQFWRHQPGIAHPERFDPVVSPSFAIGRDDPVVTAGSCFAQHVARVLAGSGFRFLVTETAHPIVPEAVAAKFNYGMFSARYGNLYTSRQLKQLLQRAYGQFEPVESVWHTPGGQIVDPFRPQIQPGGFVSESELLRDREAHFAAVRRAVESMSVFVFTLGLTESWYDTRDDAVFPLAPGVAGGRYDEQIHAFQNFGVDEVAADLQWSIDFIRQRNPQVRFVVTVSPVPLNATAVDQHVFVATTYSKAVLRVAAEQVCRRNTLCDYFPSFEIITSPFARGSYYGPDCREVNETGVQHVMSLFLRHYGDGPAAESPRVGDTGGDAVRSHVRKMEQVMDVLCDEERISND
jgi:hypothetical protein